MKPSVLRLCSAFLLMGIALMISVGMMVGAVAETEETMQAPDYVWIRLPLEAEPMEEIRLYSSEGLPVETLTADEEGKAVSKLLPVGSYYAVTEEGCSAFFLTERAEVETSGGWGWFDGQALRLTGEVVGSVTVTRQGFLDEWLEYTLENEDGQLYKVLRSGEGDLVTCHFEGVPYGSYRLEENGVFQCYITLDAETPNVTVSLS